MDEVGRTEPLRGGGGPAQARAENTGQVFNPTRTALKDAGGPPILQQGVEGEISIVAKGAEKFVVYRMDEAGHPVGPVKSRMVKGALEFTISPKDHTSYYWVTANMPE